MQLPTHFSALKVKIVLVTLAFLLCGGAWWFFSNNKNGAGMVAGIDTVAPTELASAAPYEGAALSADYRNEQFRFALDMPEGFTAAELPPDENGGVAIVLQNASGEGIQIFVTPASDERILTADDIRAAIPDMEVRDPQTVEIGDPSTSSGQADYRGTAFLSDNDAFGGESREVWFYFHENLYQISTYTRLDPLLQAMFSTWNFF